MASIYLPIWTKIKQCKRDEEVTVRVHVSSVDRIIQAVKKQKTQEIAIKKKVGMKYPGALIIRKVQDEKDKDFVKLNFSLQYSWDWL